MSHQLTLLPGIQIRIPLITGLLLYYLDYSGVRLCVLFFVLLFKYIFQTYVTCMYEICIYYFKPNNLIQVEKTV